MVIDGIPGLDVTHSNGCTLQNTQDSIGHRMIQAIRMVQVEKGNLKAVSGRPRVKRNKKKKYIKENKVIN